jgi:hypothetical protein
MPALACLLALSALAGCGGDSPGMTPAGPTGPVYSLTGVVREKRAAGDGPTVRDVLVQAIAGSSTLAVARSDASGRFTLSGVASNFQVVATKPGYKTTTSTVVSLRSHSSRDLSLEPVPRAVTGRVTESAPTESELLAGARVEIVSGPRSGVATTTDASGAYRFDGVWGEFQIRATASGYEPSSRTLTMGDTDADETLRLAPVARVITETINNPVLPFPNGFSRTFNVHHAGEIAVTDYFFQGFEEGDYTILRLWEGDRLVAVNMIERVFPRQTISLRVPVAAGHRYRLTVSNTLGYFATITIRYPS